MVWKSSVALLSSLKTRVSKSLLFERNPCLQTLTQFLDEKGKWVDDSASELYVKNNAIKNPCSRRGARGVWNMGQTCYQSVILQALLHDPILNAYFLAGGHDVHTCKRSFCMACAAAEVFMDFNNGEKTEAVSAATLLYHGWDASRVRIEPLLPT